MLFKESDIFGTNVKLGSETVFKKYDLPEMMMNPWFVFESTLFGKLLFDLADERFLTESEYTDKARATITKELFKITERDVFSELDFRRAKGDVDRVVAGNDPYDSIGQYVENNNSFITIVKQKNIPYNRDNTLRRVFFVIDPDYAKYTPFLASIISFLASLAVLEGFNVSIEEAFRDLKKIIYHGSELVAIKIKDYQTRDKILKTACASLDKRSDYFEFGYRICDPMRYTDFKRNLVKANIALPSKDEGLNEKFIEPNSAVIIVELIGKKK